MDDQNTIFHPFVSGALDTPPAKARVLVLGAGAGLRFPSDWRDVEADFVQGFRPEFLKLEAAGNRVFPDAPQATYDLALVLAGRHRGQNEAWIAEAWRLVREGGRIVVAGGKLDGIDSLRKRTATQVGIAGHLSKNHGVVFWLGRTGAAAPFADAATVLVDGRFETSPGMFSHDRIDAGSRFLVDNLPGDLTGSIADFGAGWGYLSATLAERSTGLTRLDLYEADHAALAAAERNLSRLRPDVPARFFWRDLLSEPAPRDYDAIVMNPPFHASREVDPAMGAGMIAAASKALKPRGRLFLVANRGLPYEKALAAGFARSGEIARDGSFKVLWAVR